MPVATIAEYVYLLLETCSRDAGELQVRDHVRRASNGRVESRLISLIGEHSRSIRAELSEAKGITRVSVVRGGGFRMAVTFRAAVTDSPRVSLSLSLCVCVCVCVGGGGDERRDL